MKQIATFVMMVLMALMSFGCKKGAKKPQARPGVTKVKASAVTIDRATLAAFAALPDAFQSKDNPLTPAKIALGRALFYDKRLSKNHDISCNSCHNLQTYGVDNKPTSEGHKKQHGNRNSPTVYNAAGHFVQFWDGRSPNVEHQATQPVLNPVEMAMPSAKAVVKVLKSIPGYVKMFRAAFPKEKEPITFKNMGIAIGAFERKLVTPSRWDKFLHGDEKALTDKEKKGVKAFIAAGCTACHNGALLGGAMYQKLGLVKPWPTKNKDQGRFEVTKKVTDKMFFKVPSLRNVEKTGPYLHDGSVKSLPKVVEMMAKYQLGRTLKKEQVALIVAFLKTLTGKIPAKYIAKPALPPSGKNTPKPDPS